MDLQITHQDNLFSVKGKLHRGNVHLFKNEFRDIFEKQSSLTLNIESLASIDRYGVNALAQLHNESLLKGKNLAIIGMGSDDLYEHFNAEEHHA